MWGETGAIGAVLECLEGRGATCEVLPRASDNPFGATAAALERLAAEREALAESGETALLIKPDALLASDWIAADLPRLDRPLERDIERVSIVARDAHSRIRACVREAGIIDGKAVLTTLFDDVKDRIAALRLHWSHLSHADPNGVFLDFYADSPLILARFPTPDAWTLPAYVSAGREDIQTAAWECAIFRHWGERFGATPFAISSSGWHLFVDRAPQDVQGAIELMLEQISFCPSLLEFAEHPDFRNGWALGAPRWGFWRPTALGGLPPMPRRRSAFKAMMQAETMP